MSVMPFRGGAAREAELLGAVLEVLRETGYDRLTVDAVVARARASKQTVYRRWPSKAELVVAAFVNAVSRGPGDPDTGSVRGDLLALMDLLLDELAELGDVIVGLLGELGRNADLAAAMEEHYIGARRRSVLAVFERARARGEVSEEADVELVWQAGPAILFFKALVSREPVDRELARRIVDQVMLPLL
ncbi:TetR/AcrR family transcriptional regulator [Nonomuraea basaltis]|uniref:TetR/AcrR family transcriptional regulator n=1 Tax=Nonomuraea basaltis TaxID=2495887 RepID=UPI00110C6F92|nr:TetR/AcrR family transcriptional regulator [Nonomuraea basaltis]TMR92758.1 TetR/AcrR family transcriptional regulator [Nonomuraea basaltis]